jgi:hypothetical protein
MDSHFIITSYKHAPQLKTTQLYLTDGRNVQYINGDGSLGKLYVLEKLTGQTGDLTVDYATADIVLVRSVGTTMLYAITAGSGESINLSKKLINVEDSKEWDRADGKDSFILTKMLVLTNRKENVLTFTYTPLPEGKVKTVFYTLVSN